MKHNTVLLNFPTQWRSRDILTTSQRFVDSIRTASAAKLAILLAKNTDDFPENHMRVSGRLSDEVIAGTGEVGEARGGRVGDTPILGSKASPDPLCPYLDEKVIYDPFFLQMSGKVDVWWIVHDGGMLMLLPFLLRQHRVWRNTQLRIFTVAGVQDNSVKMREDLRTFLYHLRIDGEADVIELVRTALYSPSANLSVIPVSARHRHLRFHLRKDATHGAKIEDVTRTWAVEKGKVA